LPAIITITTNIAPKRRTDGVRAIEVGATELAVVHVDGGTLTVETTGAGPPVLFVHGWTLDRRAWDPQLGHFGRGRRLVTYDRRGCGESTAPPDLSREIDDIASVLDAVDIERAAIVGLSQGCRVSLGLALRFPQRVSALVLAGSPPPHRTAGPETEPVPLDQLAALASAGQYRQLRALLRDHPLLQLGAAPETALLDAIIESYRGRDLVRPAGELVLSREALARLQTPTLLLVGERDSSVRRAAARELADLLPYSRLAVVKEAYHLCNLSHPARFNAALADFLDAHDGC
jgi:pimeloyl-ACP methyl ester carboxylesterase